MKVTYLEKGAEHDFKRIDHVKSFRARSYFRNGGLIYFRVDEFNLKVIAEEDIIKIEEE